MGHVGHDEDLAIGKNRSKDIELWKQSDPIQKIEKLLLDSGEYHVQQLLAFQQQLKQTLEKQYEVALNSKWPSDVFRYEIK
jgi:TPP-dependent pyruvate/acetoin dehydrogenase alpha subunit